MTHVDVAWLADRLGVDDSRWCHGTVDTDCLLQVLVENSLGSSEGSADLAGVFEHLSIDRHRLLEELRVARPAEYYSRMMPAGALPVPSPMAGRRRPTGRFVLVVYRVRRANPGSDVAMTPLAVLQSLLMEDQGPAAEALEAVGVTPWAAREALGLDEARPVQSGSMWPPAPNPREFSWPDGQRGQLPYPAHPAPSPGTTPSSFVWTSPTGQELELSAVRNGPIRLRARAGSEATVEFDAAAAEILARHLMDFHAQLEIERWEPVFDAEVEGRPKPPPPTSGQL